MTYISDEDEELKKKKRGELLVMVDNVEVKNTNFDKLQNLLEQLFEKIKKHL